MRSRPISGLTRCHQICHGVGKCDRTPPEVVTVYRTSKMDKYRSEP